MIGRDLSRDAIAVVLAELDSRRASLAAAKSETERITFQLLVDEALEELARRNKAELSARADRAVGTLLGTPRAPGDPDPTN